MKETMSTNELDILCFFDGKPAALALYGVLAQRTRAMVPDLRIEAKKTQISFYSRHCFAAVSFLPVRRAKDRPKEYITVTFGLAYRLDSPRIDAASEPYPRRWTHHVLVAAAEEIDSELLGWIREAAEFAARK